MRRNNGWIPLADQKPTEADGETVLMWHAFQATMPEKPEDWHRNRFYVYWQPVPEIGWTRTAERMPERQDADENNCVLAKDADGRVKVTGWHQFEHNPYLTRWMRTPAPPDDRKELRQKNY